MNKDVIISLSTDTSKERKCIEIDGQVYELVSADDLSFKEYVQMDEAGKKISEAFTNPNDNKVDKAVSLLNDMVKKIVIGLPDSVFRKLSDRQKSLIVIKWGEATRVETENESD